MAIAIIMFIGWGDGYPLPRFRGKEQRDQFKKQKKGRGMATVIPTILPAGDGEMITSFLV